VTKAARDDVLCMTAPVPTPRPLQRALLAKAFGVKSMSDRVLANVTRKLDRMFEQTKGAMFRDVLTDLRSDLRRLNGSARQPAGEWTD
jgi:hypothetical protein